MADQFPSPNHGARADGLTPRYIVLHATCMEDFDASRARLCDPASEVSAHWLIDLDGRSEQLVDESRRAWHAGEGEWRGEGDLNSRSIGIELQNTGHHPFPEPQMAALETLLREIMERHSISPENVIAHSDLAPGRKTDPGPHFDWRRLALQGLAAWPDKITPDDPAWLEEQGYGDAPTEVLSAAARLRYNVV